MLNDLICPRTRTNPERRQTMKACILPDRQSTEGYRKWGESSQQVYVNSTIQQMRSAALGLSEHLGVFFQQLQLLPRWPRKAQRPALEFGPKSTSEFGSFFHHSLVESLPSSSARRATSARARATVAGARSNSQSATHRMLGRSGHRVLLAIVARMRGISPLDRSWSLYIRRSDNVALAEKNLFCTFLVLGSVLDSCFLASALFKIRHKCSSHARCSGHSPSLPFGCTAGCTYDVNEPQGICDIQTPVSFAGDILPLLDMHCTWMCWRISQWRFEPQRTRGRGRKFRGRELDRTTAPASRQHQNDAFEWHPSARV